MLFGFVAATTLLNSSHVLILTLRFFADLSSSLKWILAKLRKPQRVIKAMR